MMTVHELNENQLEELKESYIAQLYDIGKEIDTDNITDEAVIEHYEGIMFTEEDFFCSIN